LLIKVNYDIIWIIVIKKEKEVNLKTISFKECMDEKLENETYIKTLKNLFKLFTSSIDTETENNCIKKAEQIKEKETPGVISELEDIFDYSKKTSKNKSDKMTGNVKVTLRGTDIKETNLSNKNIDKKHLEEDSSKNKKLRIAEHEEINEK
jgi:hypothetical protein